jgi:homoserine dehydrogenase
MIEDRPGVLAEIAGILGRFQISIASVIQHEPSDEQDGGSVPLVIMTHNATEGAAQRALSEIDRLACVRAASVKMPVLD